jgi:hypothetical protein
MDVPLPGIGKRLQKRYLLLVEQHMDAVTALAAGIHALPQAGDSFAAAQAAWRFFDNERTTLPALVEPLREMGRRGASQSRSSYALLIHDWSKVDYDGHKAKTDQVQLSNAKDHGYEMLTALLVDAATGSPLAPMEISLLASAGHYTTAHAHVNPRAAHLDQILPVMQASHTWAIDKRLVHIIDREGDSLLDMRQWQANGHLFLVRGDDRRVHFRAASHLLTGIVGILEQEKSFHFVRDVEIQNQSGKLFVAETEVILDGDAWQRDDNEKKYRVPGAALTLRFVVAQVRDAEGRVLAEWLLLTNVPADISADLIATWYYWRWRIETFHKLIKSAGLQMEHWLQETALRIAKRLVVACMVCVVVWQLERQTTPEAEECKKLLMDLSGRQTKRKRRVTTSGLLAGLHVLLMILGVLQQYTPEELGEIAKHAIPAVCPSG